MPLAVFVAAICISVSCKKVVDNNGGGDGGGQKLDTANSTVYDRLYDSLYLYAQQTYYWNDQLPTYADFLPRQYKNADTLKGLAEEQYQLTRFPKDGSGNLYEQLYRYVQNPNTGAISQVPDNTAAKYSYILKTSETVNGGASDFARFGNDRNKFLKMTLDGKDSSLGFIPGLITIGAKSTYANVTVQSDSTLCIVQWVTNGSPAYQAGLRRGSLIAKVNGRSLTDMTDADVDYLNDAINAKSIILTVRDGDSGIKTKNLSFSQKLYTFNPIFKDTTLTIDGKKIGYIAFQTFSSNAGPLLDQAFKTKLNGATDLVVDLRYNGGGYVSTAEHLVDLIAPTSASGKVMYTAYYNQMMVNKKAPILKKVPLDYDNPGDGTWFDLDLKPSADNENTTAKINKSVGGGGLGNLKNVYFIVSSGTASASELTINSLKPYLGVKLIGAGFGDDGKLTYGKPVGFFEIRIGSYSMWMPNFETRNANDEGGYYKGMSTDYAKFDDIANDFGDKKEEAFAQAIAVITGNTAAANTIRQLAVKRAVLRTESVGKVIKTNNMVIKPIRLHR